ncbi:PD-(D/E)XK nuclease family protein [Aquabacterium sp.]|uniref:PD-(D/E)XK nuclease family protein n=1 Tax=Aquabacterium sp. TaxID=1872578 RepID=UPI002487CC2D|nr:PD-(D/E)XK nuclease family protein [Aquabacterium sp.]MDI1259166.1 PD-(D/E)XK nuclease family protein [Aquabacterium sp.]
MTVIVSTENEVLSPTAWPWAQGRPARDCWDDWAGTVSRWCADNGVSARDVVVLLPVGALLPVARQAWARTVGGWLPQIETVPTLAQSLDWSLELKTPAPTNAELGPAPTLDVVLDRLLVTQALSVQAWGRQWAQRDRRAFEHAVTQVVDCAHLWVRVAQACPPDQRVAYWATCREALIAVNAASTGPGARERLLLAWALEWAASSDDGHWATDVLFSHRAAAWVGVTAGETVVPGSESSVMLTVLRQAARSGVPTLWMNAEAAPAQLDDADASLPALARCLDFEDEAQQAAAHVLSAVQQARASAGDPVALIALDRSLVRRVRALLEGAGATLSDETGWKLSTTRAGAAVTRMLAASQPRASTDDLLDWLKSGWVSWPEFGAPAELDEAVAALETWCRRHGLLVAWGLSGHGRDLSADLVPEGRQAMPEPARRLWSRAWQTVQLLAPLWAGGRAPLSAMLAQVAEALRDCGAWQVLEGDVAGVSVLKALHLSTDDGGETVAWPLVTQGLRMDGQGLSRWVDDVLEESSFRLESAAAGDAKVDVVVTPLTRAVLRPFSAVVMPGSDEGQLGAMNGVPGWVHGALSEQMGLPTKATTRDAQWASFALLMAQPGMVCLCRKANGREPLEPSPWFERWSMHTGQALGHLQDVRLMQRVATLPMDMPRPRLRNPPTSGVASGGLTLPLPAQITATSYESLRQCPYRFFARHVLNLRQLDELEEGVDRSDFGVWLHAVLQSFHTRRDEVLGAKADDVALWVQAAQDVTQAQGLDRDSRRPFFLPFAATLERLAVNYVAWLHGHEGQGWRFAKAEEVVQWPMALSCESGEDLMVTLHGQLDRLDRRGQGGEDAAWTVIDYKTGSLEGLKQKVRQPLEDTQLAFYAALAQHASATADPGDPQRVTTAVEGLYLQMDEKGVTPVQHPHVIESAQALVEGVRMDLTRLLAGAAMPALGEGVACEYCEVRGLCRRDHWTLAEVLP